MEALLWALCVVLMATGSHALIQPAAAGGFPASADNTTAMTTSAAQQPANINAKLPKFSRATAHVYVANPPASPTQASPRQVPLERLEIRHHKGDNGFATKTTTRYSGKSGQEAGKPSSSYNKKTEYWQKFEMPELQMPSMDIKRPEGWPKVEMAELNFSTPASARFSSWNEHEDYTADSSSEPDKHDSSPSTFSTPADSSDAESSSCSRTDSSAEAVLRCVNAVRTNPRAFADGYECSYGSWIDKASSPQRPALTVDDRLTTSATKHAAWMAMQKTVSHVGDGGSTVAQRIKAEGYATYPQAENVAGGQRSAYEVTMDWMCSEGHRNTILNCDYDNIGTGVSADDNGRLYYAQNFGASDKCSNTGCKC